MSLVGQLLKVWLLLKKMKIMGWVLGCQTIIGEGIKEVK